MPATIVSDVNTGVDTGAVSAGATTGPVNGVVRPTARYANEWQTGNQFTPGNGTLPFVSRNDDDYASQTYANIKKAQWNDYMDRYPAIHQEYLDTTLKPDFTLQQVDRVEGNVAQSFDRARNSQGATLARMGLSNDVPSSGVAESLATAHGENSVRAHGKDRKIATLGGGSLPNLQTQTG